MSITVSTPPYRLVEFVFLSSHRPQTGDLVRLDDCALHLVEDRGDLAPHRMIARVQVVSGDVHGSLDIVCLDGAAL